MEPILNNLINLDPNRDLWNGHLIDYTNPHKVTAKQVGAATPEYVDNAIASMDVPVDRIIDGISKTEVNNLIDNIQVDVTSDIPIHLSINSNGGLRITY